MQDSTLPFSPSEALRLQELAGLEIMDTPREQEFDAIVELAHRLLDCPIALVSLIDDHRQWFKARCGIDAHETSRDVAFCTHAIPCADVMVVEDTRLDPRFAANPFVTGEPHVRFYAGAPLRPSHCAFGPGLPAIGTLCIVDTRPRTLGEDDKHVLRTLAGLVESLIRARAAAAAMQRASQQVQADAALIDRKNRQLRQAERMAAIGSWRVDLASGDLEWSDEVFAIHGLPVGPRPPLADALNFYPERERARIAHLLDRATRCGEPYEFESDLTTAVGTVRRVRALGEVEFTDGVPAALIGVFQDITDQYQHETKLRQTANTDSLTGLPNRRMFEERLEDQIGHATRGGSPYAIVLIDLDGFKPVNDTFGHDAGDEVLREMAGRLRRGEFSNAFAARLGGDEFVILVTRPRDCAALPDFVQMVLRELRYLVDRDGARLVVTSTVGAALFDPADADADVLRNADLALYAAKRSQRGTGRIAGSNVVLRPWGSPGAPAILVA